jgi:membrane-associated protease RseP (regulator of RpoE activity)
VRVSRPEISPDRSTTSAFARCGAPTDAGLIACPPCGQVEVHSRNLNQIIPALVPHVRLAVLRHTGNAIHADKCAHEWGHNHQRAVDEGHRLGGNAYFHDSPQPLGAGQFEVRTTIAVAHPGPVTRAIRDRYFPGGEVVQVLRLIPGSVAERAGLAVNDLIVSANGAAAPLSTDAMLEVFNGVPPGGPLTLEVIHGGTVRTLAMVRAGTDKFGVYMGVDPILEVVP